ncbi:hypothetical protein AVP3_0064 [Aeromonas phage AVP3]
MALFTYSSNGKTPAEVNPLSAYVEEIRIARCSLLHYKHSPSPESVELKRQGFVFAGFLDCTYSNLAYYVKPSAEIVAAAAQRFGGRGVCMKFNICPSGQTRVVWHDSLDGTETGFQCQVIAGDLDTAEYLAGLRAAKFYGDADALIKHLYQGMSRSTPHYKKGWARSVFIAVGAVTGQPSVIEDAKLGKYDDFYLFGSSVCFIRKNWKVCEPHYCQQCGGMDH